MSRFQSTRRRLSLLASSSLVAASLTAAMSVGVALTPATAFAANECEPEGTSPAANGAAADTFVCDEVLYASGITYSSIGDLTVEGSVPPEGEFPAAIDVYGDGIRLTGNGADDVTFDAMGHTINTYEETRGSIDVTGGGAISVTATNGVNSINRSGTHGIYAEGASAEAMTITGSYIFGDTGIEARNVGDVSVSGFIVSGTDIDGASQPDTYGIRANSSAGNVSVNANSVTGFTGVEANALGNVTIGGDGITGTGSGGYGISATSTGGGSIAITASGTSGATGIEATTAGDISIIGFYATGSEGDAVNATSTGGGTVTVDVYGASGFTGIEATSAGDVNVSYADGGGATGFGDHGVNATSTGGGDVTVTAGGTTFGVTTAVRATSSGGDGDVTITGRSFTSDGTGIYGEVAGSGALTIGIIGEVGAMVGIDAVTGTGPLTINLTQSADISGFSAGIRTDVGGDALIDIGDGSSVNAFSGWAFDLGIADGTTTTINLDAGRAGSMLASGDGNLVINNNGVLRDAWDLSGLTGGVDMTIGEDGLWYAPNVSRIDRVTPEAIVLSAGADTVTVQGRVLTGMLTTNFPLPEGATPLSASTTIDFGAGDDAIISDGEFVLHFNARGLNPKSPRLFKSTTHVLNLETFTHSGVMLMGAVGTGGDTEGTGPLVSDGWHDDALFMPGTTWVGDGGAVVFGVDLNTTTPQTNCSDRTADGDLIAADCISLIGGATEGVTIATIVDAVPGDRGVYIPDGIVLVDVSGDGAGGHQGDFVLGPNSSSYSEEAGGIIDKGLFFYTIAYDAEDKQHKLYGLPGTNVLKFPIMATAAHSLWRVSTGTWSDRQADVRGSELENGFGFWVRGSGEFANRDLIQSVEAIGNTYAFNNSYEQTSYAFTTGLDLLIGGGGDTTYVVGLMGGYAHTQLEYENSVNTAAMDGWTGGAYASLLSGPFFVDAAINANKLVMDNDVPGLGLLPEGTILSTDLLSLGGVVEAGWRWAFMEGAFIEPLAAVSYVRTTFDDMTIIQSDPVRTPSTVEYDDATSLRAGLGARLGLDADYGSMRAQYFVLGRLWNEFEGENGVTINNAGPDAFAVDDFSGQFTEFGMGASLYSAGGGVSGFLNVGGKFADDYKAVNGTAGVRVNW